MPYYGKVSIDGINYHGSAQFSFSLEDANGTEHWRNGADVNESIRVFVVNGRYSVMLGGQGMNPLPPELFLKYENLYLRVKFDTGDGPRSLGPDQLITATPRALVAEVAKVAKVAEKLSSAITSDMLSPEVRSKLDANQSAAPMGPITRDMLPADVLTDLNKSFPAITSITRDMLPADVLADLNKTAPAVGPITLSMLAPEVSAKLERNASAGISGLITRDMLPDDVLADLNQSAPAVGPITLSMLDAEVTAKLDSNTSGSTTVNNPPAVGSLIAIPYGDPAPAGYSLYQRGTPKELVWEEKASVSVARGIHDGAAVLDGMIYVVGGEDGTSAKNIAERYDPTTNSWETLASMSVARDGISTATLNGKIYVIGGQLDTSNVHKSVEIFDPTTGIWSNGISLPSKVRHGAAITKGGKIYLIGGRDSNSEDLDTVYEFDPLIASWTVKASMPTKREAAKLVVLDDRIWVIGGQAGSTLLSTVESFDPATNSWRTEASLNYGRHWRFAWLANENIFVGGGYKSSEYFKTIEVYDSASKNWSDVGNLHEYKAFADAVVLNDKVYVIAGQTASGVYSNKVFAADLNASMAGVYDLYRKDGNASAGTPLVQAEVADGSVTASKMASNTITTSQLNEQILKYLKPEITAQPQPLTVYADSNVSYSVSAEGKYLTYQWRKDGVDLAGETNATLTLTDANSTQHDGNYSVVVSNDFGSVESNDVEILVSDALMNGLIGWWKFDETNGTVAYDSSGNSNDGSLTNGPTWTAGKIGGALNFDGIDDRIKIPHTMLDGKSFLTISFWFKMNSSSVNTAAHYFISGANVGNDNRFRLLIHSSLGLGKNDSEIKGSITYASIESNSYWTSDWRKLTFVRSINGLQFYLNGNPTHLFSYTPSSLTISANGLWVGSDQDSVAGGWETQESLQGKLDDYRIYDRALSADEVQALHNLGQ